MQIVPDYRFETAPKASVVVVPEQSDRSPKVKAWLRKMATESDYVMSVCTSAFILADAGLLDGKKATTHHSGNQRLQVRYPAITVERGRWWVQGDAKINCHPSLVERPPVSAADARNLEPGPKAA